MKNPLQYALASIVLFAAMFAVAKEPLPSTTSAKRSETEANEAKQGERLFQTRCGNCHRSPDQIPARISKTVVRHMRVRAILSAEDERLIMKYLAPE